MKRARLFTLLALAVIVVAFAATWLTVPGGRYELRNLTTGRWESGRIAYPARLFRFGLSMRYRLCAVATTQECRRETVYRRVKLDEVKTRIFIVYGSAAAVVALVGLAFGAARRTA